MVKGCSGTANGADVLQERQVKIELALAKGSQLWDNGKRKTDKEAREAWQAGARFDSATSQLIDVGGGKNLTTGGNVDKSDQAAFEVAKLLYGEGLIHSSADSLSERIRGIHKGLSKETEFAAIVSWLGNCQAIFKVDTDPATIRAESGLKAPDFIAFPVVNGVPVPVLIEVKGRDRGQLNWSEKYLSSLVRFAELVELPLLIAWNWKGLWLLVEHSHFEKNVTAFRLTLEKAFKEDLMSLLFKDFRITLNPNFQFFIDLDILDPALENDKEALPEQFHAKIVDVGYLFEGSRIEQKREYLRLLLAVADEGHLVRTGARQVRQIFQPAENTISSLSRAFIAEVAMGRQGDPDWHDVLRRGPLASSGEDYRKSLAQAVHDGIVLQWFDIEPNTPPSFLG
ncbi:MAG: hypothetical protein WAN65_13015 [Candidatus Sulfotelmatobacter sp.]